MKNILNEMWWWAKQVPVTIGILVISILAGIATKALWVSADSSGLTERYGWGLAAFKHGDFLNIFTGALIAPAPWMYILILLPIALGAGFLEYRYGALRMLAALFITHIGAVLAVALLIFALEPTHLPWVMDFATVRDVGLSNAGFGALGAATAALDRVWRRRARTLLVLYCCAFVLFSGVIWDLTHFASVLIGFAIGPWVVKRSYEKFTYQLNTQERRNLTALILIFNVITILVSRIYPGNGGLLSFHNPGQAHEGSMLLIIGTSVFLVLLAYGLYAGRKVAWNIAITLVGLSLFASLFIPLSAPNVFHILLSGTLFSLLILFKSAFAVLPDKLVRHQVYKRIAIIGLGLLIFNTLAIYGIRSSFHPIPTLPDAFGESVAQIVGSSTRTFIPVTITAEFFINSISYLWLTVVAVSITMLIFTTIRERDERGGFDDYDKILHQKGSQNSISWMTRWDGMSYWTNFSKTAGFAYRLENNFAIVLGDPVGSRQAVAAAFENFETMCLRRGWHPIYYSVTDAFKNSIRKQKLKSIMVGEDTIIDLPELTFTGKSWQSVRSAVNRANKDGVRMRAIKYSEAPIGLRDQLQNVAAGWVNDKSLPEMGFTLGTLKEAEDPEVRMHIAIDEDGTVHGMTSWFPVYKNGRIAGWTIDIMQRRLHKDTMPGVIEFLIAESATTFKQEGYDFISLSVAPLAHSGKAHNSIERLLDVVAKRMEPYYGFKSLASYKQKFNPRHNPVYLCYHDEARLPAIALAIGKAYMPDHVARELIASTVKGKK